ncbi:MAG: flippase [Comamonadaceae bacterium]|nr:MAG: flippase [Comamonadaceae bacterium]
MSLSKNTAFTMTAAALQIGLTLVTLPMYLSLIGLDRYGVVVFIWLVFEYMLLFNLGLDRATINFLSRYRDDAARATSHFWAAMAVCAATGALAALFVYACFPFVLSHLLSISPSLMAEMGHAFLALTALALISIAGSILAALLQAHERFFELNLAQLAMSAAFQIAPLLAATVWSARLETIIVVGAAARSLQTILYLAFCLRRKHRLGRPVFSRVDATAMLRYGAWTSISGVISPIVVNLDRVLIGTLSGSAAVALYALPYNLVMKAQLIPTSLASAMFPRLSQDTDVRSRMATAETALLMLAIVLSGGLIVGSFLLEPFLTVWIRQFVSRDAVLVGQFLILGIWFNGLAIVPFVWLQATGRPDRVAKVHMAELVPFVLLLWAMVANFGIVGAAIAWTLRVIADSAAMFYAAGIGWSRLRRLAVPLCVVIGAVVFNCLPQRSAWAAGGAGVVLMIFLLAWAWRNSPAAMLAPVQQLLRRFAWSPR